MDAAIGEGDASFSDSECADSRRRLRGGDRRALQQSQVSVSTEVTIDLAIASAQGKTSHQHILDQLTDGEMSTFEGHIQRLARERQSSNQGRKRRLSVAHLVRSYACHVFTCAPDSTDGLRRRLADMTTVVVEGVDVGTFAPTSSPTLSFAPTQSEDVIDEATVEVIADTTTSVSVSLSRQPRLRPARR